MRLRTYVALGAVATIAVVTGLWRVAKARRWQTAGVLVWHVETSEKVVALTFDDGPMPGHVDEVLEVLDLHHARATFFLTGKGIETDSVDAAKIVAAKHEVGNHSYSHQRMVLRSDEFVRDEVERTDRLIRALGFEGEIFFRPPFGKKLIGLPLYLANHQRRTVMWSVEAEEDGSRGENATSIADHVVANVEPGAIILFHVFTSSRAAEREALPEVLDRLSRAGYRFVTVSELLTRGEHHSPL